MAWLWFSLCLSLIPSQADMVGTDLSRVSMNCWEMSGTTKCNKQQLQPKWISKTCFPSIVHFRGGVCLGVGGGRTNSVSQWRGRRRIKSIITVPFSLALFLNMLLTPTLLNLWCIVTGESVLGMLPLKYVCFCSLPNSLAVSQDSFVCSTGQSLPPRILYRSFPRRQNEFTVGILK